MFVMALILKEDFLNKLHEIAHLGGESIVSGAKCLPDMP